MHPLNLHFSRLLPPPALAFAAIVLAAAPLAAAESGCPGSANPDAQVIFCDDYDSPQPVAERFVEYNDAGGSFAREAGVGVDGSHAMRVRYQPGQVGAGWLLRVFGRTPPGYHTPQSHGDQDFREIYWREYVRTAPGWQGSPDKLSRVYSAARGWTQAMIAHLWTERGQPHLWLDPAGGIGADGSLVTNGYNDFGNLRWLGGSNPIPSGWSGEARASTAIFAAENADRWFCIEAHARLNTPGSADGVFELWVDGQQDARLEGLDWVGSWQEYGINAILLSNYWNDGSPQENTRYRDNLVVATRRIGCLLEGPPSRPMLLHP